VIAFIGLIGFLVGLTDDLLKKRKGLKNSIRLAVWYGAAFIIVYFRYYLFGSEVFFPFLGPIDMQKFYMISGVFFFVGVVNAVNMTDSLDDL
jgi:UDP-N-acetylmuramyl pentapeptide phosphotransferase/UDP-N-acetylglucosamine-1-phosphate transferase